MYAFNSSTWKDKARKASTFEVSQFYILKPCLKKKQKIQIQKAKKCSQILTTDLTIELKIYYWSRIFSCKVTSEAACHTLHSEVSERWLNTLSYSGKVPAWESGIQRSILGKQHLVFRRYEMTRLYVISKTFPKTRAPFPSDPSQPTLL